MKANYFTPVDCNRNGVVNREAVIHTAGHATAIYLGNRQKQLPAVFFQICIAQRPLKLLAGNNNTVDYWAINLEGGRLIDPLPDSLEQMTREFSEVQMRIYQHAIEADIFNLLVGPLSEAKYVALRDDEPINPHLVSLQALHYYGGATNLKLIYNYIKLFTLNQAERGTKLTELFLKAYSFVNTPTHWQAIMALAHSLEKINCGVVNHQDVAAIIGATSK